MDHFTGPTLVGGMEVLKSPGQQCSGAGGQNGQWCYAAESDGWLPLGTVGVRVRGDKTPGNPPLQSGACLVNSRACLAVLAPLLRLSEQHAREQ